MTLEETLIAVREYHNKCRDKNLENHTSNGIEIDPHTLTWAEYWLTTQSDAYKRGYDAAIRHLDRYKLYRKFIRPMMIIRRYNGSDDRQSCIPVEDEEKWYPEEDLDDLIEKFKHLDAVFTKLGFDEKYELLYTIRNLKGEQGNENY